MDSEVRVLLPGGLWRGGRRVREVALRPVAENDDRFLLETAGGSLPCERATALLARCLTDVDGGEDTARELTIGDREALLLHLRRLAFGETVDCVLRCPRAECGERLELTLRVKDLLLSPYEDARSSYDATLAVDGTRYDVAFRLPRSDDLDHAAAIARTDPPAGALELLRRCLMTVDVGGSPVSVDALPEAARAAIAGAMVERDPQAELELDLSCPACEAPFEAIFDTATFFLQELDARARRLLREVHALALRYHWSETDILSMPAWRRAQYLELLSDNPARERTR